MMRRPFAGYCVAVSLLMLASCSPMAEPTGVVATTPTAAAAQQAGPPVAKITASGPVGLYYMQRFWAATNTLEKAVWYLSPEGEVYENLATGFSAEDLAAHRGRKGTRKLVGEKMEVTWSDGKTVSSTLERDDGGAASFAWDGGLFAPARPIADAKTLVGEYEGGTSVASSGNVAIVSKSLSLEGNGSFRAGGVASLESAGDDSTVTAGAASDEQGTWTASSYSLTLKYADGRTVRGIAFPFYDDDQDEQHDRLFFQGTMYKRQ